ncbi:MAG: transposase [Psychromonas sp.]
MKTLEKIALTQVKLSKNFQKLLTIDGIGNILALTIMLEMDDIERFNEVRNYASYYRCISGARYSNSKKKGKTNSKDGNKYLAWAFVESPNFAIRYNKTVKVIIDVN